MPTSTLYDSTRAALDQHLPQVRASQRQTLALVIAGAVQTQASQVAAIARALPLDTQQAAKEQRIRRFLDNARITQAQHYQPIVQQSLQGLKNQAVSLLLDRVVLRNQHNILVVSLAFRRRSLPLSWRVLPHRGSSTLHDRISLITQATALLPSGVRITVHGDKEFRSWPFFQWLREHGYNAMLGVEGRLWSYAASTSTAGTLLADQLRAADGAVVYLTQVYLTAETRYGPVNVIAWWERDPDGQRLLRGTMTNLPATPQTKRLGTRRMWIETVFRDWQSGGFHLDRSGLVSGERIERLLLALAIAYLWLVSVGRWVVKRGYRRLIDDGTPRCWHYSLFQLGVGWLMRCVSKWQPFRLLWYIYT